METILWEVKYLSPPKVLRYCKKCGKMAEYISSGLFRVNAQRKALDIWLIYRCNHCKSTWNSTIYSRISPISIPSELLNKFIGNDTRLALEYAMDAALLRKNGAEIIPPSYEVIGEEIDLTRDMKIRLISQHPFKVKVAKILREKLSLSKKAFDALASDRIIRLKNGADINKYTMLNAPVEILITITN